MLTCLFVLVLIYFTWFFPNVYSSTTPKSSLFLFLKPSAPLVTITCFSPHVHVHAVLCLTRASLIQFNHHRQHSAILTVENKTCMYVVYIFLGVSWDGCQFENTTASSVSKNRHTVKLSHCRTGLSTDWGLLGESLMLVCTLQTRNM